MRGRGEEWGEWEDVRGARMGCSRRAAALKGEVKGEGVR